MFFYSSEVKTGRLLQIEYISLIQKIAISVVFAVLTLPKFEALAKLNQL
jgi:hypothetical protein